MQTRKAFTLIEVLVVVAIIALLISILLPSLSTAREQSKRVSCATRMRSMAQLTHMYTVDDKKGFLPDLHNATGMWDLNGQEDNKRPYPYWYSYRARVWMMRKYRLTREMFYCPSNPSWNKNDHWDMAGFEGKSSVWGYVYLGNNQWLNDLMTMADHRSFWVPTPDPKDRRPITAFKITDKPQRPLLWVDLTRSADGTMDDKSGGNHIRGSIRPGTEPGQFRLPIRGGTNVGFLDSHVEWRHAAGMRLQYYRMAGSTRYDLFW